MLVTRFSSGPTGGEMEAPTRLLLLVGSSAKLSSLSDDVERLREIGAIGAMGAMLAGFHSHVLIMRIRLKSSACLIK